MNILYYFWQENSCQDMVNTFQELGHTIKIIQFTFKDYLNDPQFEQAFINELESAAFDFIFTFNYFPIIAKIANQEEIKYVSWIYDCPNLTLYSTTIKNSYNYIFAFDRILTNTILENGARHIYHLPLAANFSRIATQLQIGITSSKHFHPHKYMHDISFVGSLYEKNLFRQINYLPEYLKGYLSGILFSQKQFWGFDLISEMLTPNLCEELSKYVKIKKDSDYTYKTDKIFIDMLHAETTAQERIESINLLAEHFPLALYSASNPELCPKAKHLGYISYFHTMPKIFHFSKLNINITLRSIQSGIPLRAIDILACGGSLLSNYQVELAEYLIPGKDYIQFENLDDLLYKTEYYLSHEEERKEIAYNGYQKASRCFSYPEQVNKILTQIKNPD